MIAPKNGRWDMVNQVNFLKEVSKRKHPKQYIINTGKKLAEVGDIGLDFVVFYAEYAGKHGLGVSARNVLKAYFTPEQIKKQNEENIARYAPLNQLPQSLESTLKNFGERDYLRLQPMKLVLGKPDGTKYKEDSYAVLRNGKPLYYLKRK